ncbi:MAG TPA: UPF0175 family protein [Thermomicrobiales bacterium]|nr:UPF0175 family protein [Thermomicrobiales bacterium]
MAKTVSVAQLNHGGASRAIRDAEHEPVLVTKENQPAAWIISSDRLAEAAAANGQNPDAYHTALEAIALKLYDDETLTLSQAAKLAGLSLHDFIDLCGLARIPILRGTAAEILADVEALSRISQRSDGSE